jgi:hypothetical protein
VKAALTMFLLIAASASGFSQTQERNLMDRVMKPDMQLANQLQNRAYSGESVQGQKTSSAANTEYRGSKRAVVKDYAFTRSFLGLKNPWFGSKVFDAGNADNTAKYLIKNADREVTVKKAESVSYYDATKGAYYGSPVVPTRTFIPAPAAKGAVSQISDKINDKMTIDEVREILNKPH